MTEFPSHASPVALGADREPLAGISLRGDTEVLEALSENDAVGDLIGETRACLAEYFPEAEFTLEVLDDPEADVLPTQLVLTVITDRPPAVACARLKEFDREWWLSVLGRAAGVLSVSLEFR